MKRLNISVRYGLIAGVSTIAYLLLFYFISPRLMLNGFIIWSTLVIFLIFMYRATIQVRKNLESFPFSLALRPSFTVFVLATLIYNLFYYLMFNVFDPGLLEVQYELIQENAGLFAGLSGRPEMEDQIANLSLDDIRVTFKSVLFASARSVLGGFILSLMMAAFLRKD